MTSRGLRWVAAIAAVGAGSAVAVTAVQLGGAAKPEAVQVLSPPNVPLAAPPVAAGAGASIEFRSPQAVAALGNNSALAAAPWLFQPKGSPIYAAEAVRPSLAFPVGTTYAQALEALYASVATTGGIPAGAKLGKPLPAGQVLVPGTKTSGVVLDLRAPWGYEETSGAIASPTVLFPSSWSPDQIAGAIRDARTSGVGIPPGASVAVPSLPTCEKGGPAC